MKAGEFMELSIKYYDRIVPGYDQVDEGSVSITTPLIPIKITHRTSRKHERLILYLQHRDKWVARLHLEVPEELDLLIKKLTKIKEQLAKEEEFLGPTQSELLK